MEKVIKVKIRSIFGVDRIYPACETAEIFRKIGGTATLMPTVIENIKELGYKVVVQHDKMEL